MYFSGTGVPPANISTNFSTAEMAPLEGFVPGIYAAYFDVPTDSEYTSPLSVSLQVAGAVLSAGSTSQSLLVYIK